MKIKIFIHEGYTEKEKDSTRHAAPLKLANLKTFLRKLKKSQEGQYHRDQLEQRMFTVLECAARDQGCKDMLFEQIEEALGNCHDRVLLFFNEIEILCSKNELIKKYKDEKTQKTLKELSNFLIRCEKFTEVKNAITVKFSHDNELVEKLLYGFLSLKKLLDLPFQTTCMQFVNSGSIAVGTLTEIYQGISNKEQIDLLSQSKDWQENVLRTNSDTAREWKRECEIYYDIYDRKIERLGEIVILKEDASNVEAVTEYNTRMQQINEDLLESKKLLAKQLTQKWLLPLNRPFIMKRWFNRIVQILCSIFHYFYFRIQKIFRLLASRIQATR